MPLEPSPDSLSGPPRCHLPVVCVLLILLPLVSGTSTLSGTWVMVAVVCPWKVGTAANIQGESVERSHSDRPWLCFWEAVVEPIRACTWLGEGKMKRENILREVNQTPTLWSFVLTQVFFCRLHPPSIVPG